MQWLGNQSKRWFTFLASPCFMSGFAQNNGWLPFQHCQCAWQNREVASTMPNSISMVLGWKDALSQCNLTHFPHPVSCHSPVCGSPSAPTQPYWFTCVWGWTLCGTDETLLIQKMLFPHSWSVVGFCLIGSCLLVFIGFVVIWFVVATPGDFSHTRAFLEIFFAACLPLSDPKQKFWP